MCIVSFPETISYDDQLLMASLTMISSGMSISTWDRSQMHNINRVYGVDVKRFIASQERELRYHSSHYCTQCLLSVDSSISKCAVPTCAAKGSITFSVSSVDLESYYTSIVKRNVSAFIARTREAISRLDFRVIFLNSLLSNAHLSNVSPAKDQL